LVLVLINPTDRNANWILLKKTKNKVEFDISERNTLQIEKISFLETREAIN